ncbi:MAG: GAP family protein [Pseudohongiella sp.]|nr:GAP family protein [Pseudohongiella sp.]MDP2127280.1 GAP family protein [Pseudohongiella sp.]
MSTELLISLIGLALIDSTSIGTLLIPVWLLLDHRDVRVSGMMIYLVTIAGFYLLVGLAILLGAELLMSTDGPAVTGDEPATNSLISLLILVAQLAIGIGLFAISFRFDSSKPGATERIERWKTRAANAGTSPRFLIGLALIAAMAEVATMLPYLGAIAMITSANLNWMTVIALMSAYCLLMILPAMALLSMRLLMAERIRPVLIKVDSWITKNAESALGWVLGIAGFLIARDAIARIWTGWLT